MASSNNKNALNNQSGIDMSRCTNFENVICSDYDDREQ